MSLQKLFPWINEAWKSYLQCRSVLWWPLSFLFLTPLAVLILFGVIIPLGLNSWGFISLDHAFLNYPYLLLVAGLIFCAWFPFLDGTYRLINASIEGNSVDEDTAFLNLYNSQDMGKALATVMGGIFIIQAMGAFFKPINILALLAYMLTIFTPILLIKDGKSPWSKGLDAIRFALDNKKLLAKVWGLRLAICMSLILPWVLVASFGQHLALKCIALLVVIPYFFYMISKVLPFYFFYPAYVYEQIK